MHCWHFLAPLVLLISMCQAWPTELHDATLVARGSGSKSPSPSSPTGKGKTPAHEGHSTRLFGVNIHQTPASAPVHGSNPSTRLFGVSITPGKPSSPGHSSYSSQTSAGHSDQKEHVKLRPQLGHHVAALYTPKVAAHKRPASEQAAEQKVAQPHTGPRWWKAAGGRPRQIHPAGQGPRYASQRKYRENKKLRLLAAQEAGGHPSGHQPPKGGGPGSPGAGTHAVGKRRLFGVEY